ncbi:MAG: lantibiotic dehydratase [Actinomycetota bacterium]|nr:lantibiotic dehydratase [Actinomycetota bacterium]
MATQFRCVDAAVVRVAVFGSELDLPPWPDLTGSAPEYVEEWRSWLRLVWQQEALVEAIEVASPVLARRVGDVCGGQVQQPRRVRRVVESAVRYLLRLTSRATPFGLFAGVAPLRLGSTASVRWGERHRAVTRPDAAWLAEVIAQLEARPDVRTHLPVMANNLGFVRGDRLVVPCQQPPGIPGKVRPGDVSVRHTRAVQTVIQAARSPITIGDLIAKLAAELPGKPLAKIQKILTELVSCRILVTSLHPPMDVTDPLGHVIEQLTAMETGAAPLSVVRELRAISGQLSRDDQVSAPGARRALRASVSQQMSAICDRPEPSLAVDLRVDCSVVLPQAVAREAEAAASALVRLRPHRFGNPAWRAWHTRFLERYGSGAVVPVDQVVDADTGLGYPAGYRGSLMTPPAPPTLARDRKLLHLAQRAALDGGGEVVLDEHVLSELAADSTGAPPPHGPPHTELRFSLHAPTTDAIDRGEFTLVVVSAARQAGTTTGRFLHLFESEDRDRMVHAFTGLPTLVPGSLLAQVSCPPLSPRTGNLARTPAVFPPIPLGEHRPDAAAQIPWDELAVSGDAHRLFLVSLSQGRIVEPLMMNAIEFRRATHPLARFLCEITTARAAAGVPFDWGAANGLPFLPRVRYRRTVLRPASWHLSASDLPARRAAWQEWTRAWSGQRRRYRIPDVVHLGEQDVRIRLDLNEPAHLALLRIHLDRTGDAILAEAPDPHDYGWTGGHAHELVIPMAATDSPSAPPSSLWAGPIRATHHPGHTPGSSGWLYVKLYGHPDRQVDILTVRLPDLLSAWEDGPAEDWWFLPYRDPEPHLRLRIRLHDARSYGSAAQRLGAWADRVRSLGLLGHIVLDTYYPEVGRYGTGAAMQAAEVVFAADSAVAIVALTITASGTPHPYALIAASFTDLAAAFTGSLSSGLNWLTDHVNHHPAPALAREIHDQAMRLADPNGDWAALRALPGGEQLALAWGRRRSALAAYRAHLSSADGPDPDPVLAALLHLHHARMVGINQDSERICLRLARAAALGWAARNERSGPSPSTSAMLTPLLP